MISGSKEKLLCFSMGHSELLPLYFVPYHTVNFWMDLLKYLFEKPVLTRVLCEGICSWLDHIHNSKLIERQEIADHLAKNLVEDYKPMTDFLSDEPILNIEVDEEYPSWCMYFDRAFNVNGMESTPC